MRIKIRDHQSNSWIPLNSCYWKAKDLFPVPIYPDIEIIPAIGMTAKMEYYIDNVKYIKDEEVYEGDILIRPESFKSEHSYKVIKYGVSYLLENLESGFRTNIIDNNWLIAGNIFDNPDFSIKPI